MEKENRFKTFLSLFLTFLKVGALTFGGGYAMIPIIEREVVDKKKWMRGSEILDIIAISESTPGPIAVNSATYVGFTVGGFWGSFFATLGLVTPSFVIILAISFFYEQFMTFEVINKAFMGLKIGVVVLLFNAFFKLKKGVKINLVSSILFFIALLGMLVITIFNLNIPSPSLLFILLGILTGIFLTAIGGRKK